VSVDIGSGFADERDSRRRDSRRTESRLRRARQREHGAVLQRSEEFGIWKRWMAVFVLLKKRKVLWDEEELLWTVGLGIVGFAMCILET
jgi:hypothetical protein